MGLAGNKQPAEEFFQVCLECRDISPRTQIKVLPAPLPLDVLAA
jgi:hypothetical protein